jgi:hypothetical protein
MMSRTVRLRERREREEAEDYTERDMEYVLHRDGFLSWTEVMHWLDEHGDHDPHLSHGKIHAIEKDIQKLEGDNVPFTDNARKAFHLAHQFRE